MVGGTHSSDRSVANPRVRRSPAGQPSKKAWDMIAALGDSELATLAAYVPRVVGGDGAAWRELATRLEPLLIELLRRSRTLGPMRHNVDDCRAVMTSVLERFSKDDYRGLRLFRPWAEAHPGKDFGDWIRSVTVNLARDHVPSRLGVAERADDDVPLNKRMLSSLAARLPDAEDERIGFRPSMTPRSTPPRSARTARASSRRATITPPSSGMSLQNKAQIAELEAWRKAHRVDEAAHQKAMAPVMKDIPNTLAVVQRCNDNKAFSAAFAALGETFNK